MSKDEIAKIIHAAFIANRCEGAICKYPDGCGCASDAAQKILSAMSEVAHGQWRTIDSAPRETKILVGWPSGEMYLLALEPFDSKQGVKSTRPRAVVGMGICYPEFWMPLPSPPTDQEANESGVGIK